MTGTRKKKPAELRSARWFAPDDLRAFGLNKSTGGIARQFVLSVVHTAEGLPLMHTVHPATWNIAANMMALL